jgi:hypothetical protein
MTAHDGQRAGIDRPLVASEMGVVLHEPAVHLPDAAHPERQQVRGRVDHVTHEVAAERAALERERQLVTGAGKVVEPDPPIPGRREHLDRPPEEREPRISIGKRRRVDAALVGPRPRDVRVAEACDPVGGHLHHPLERPGKRRLGLRRQSVDQVEVHAAEAKASRGFAQIPLRHLPTGPGQSPPAPLGRNPAPRCSSG